MTTRSVGPARLLAKVSPEPNTGCWLWTGSFDSCGYGTMTYQRHTDRAHRHSWRLFRGPIPDGLLVLHNCVGMSACVNPDHLRLGTHRENMADRARQDRAAKGLRNGNYTHPETHRGERVWSARLTESDVREIRRRYAAGEKRRHLARAFRVGSRAINYVVARQTWRHIL